MDTRRVRCAFCALLVTIVAGAALPARADETPASVASRMRMHVENAGLHWADEPIVGNGELSTRAAGTVGQLQSLLVDLAGSEPNVAVTKVEMYRAADSLQHRGAPLMVTVTMRMVSGTDEATRREQWTMPALMTLVLRSVVQSQQGVVMSGQAGAGTFRIDGRIRGANGAGPLIAGLGPGPGKLVTAAEIKQSKVVEGVPDERSRSQQRDNLVMSFVVTGTYVAQNLSVDALKALSYQ